MTDRLPASGQQDRPSEERNPFAPPPEGEPDRPWQPRVPRGEDHGDQDGGHDGGHDGEGPAEDDPARQRARWGSQWSRRQPKRQSGGFGDPPASEHHQNGAQDDQRWDPSDPAQRHARYAVLAGMWGVFTGLLGWEWLALLLGSLALYWGISALRGGPEDDVDADTRDRRVEALEGLARPADTGRNGRNGRPALAAAVTGVALATAALLIVGATYAMQLVYKDYFDCVADALTTPARQSCDELLPSQLRPLLEERD